MCTPARAGGGPAARRQRAIIITTIITGITTLIGILALIAPVPTPRNHQIAHAA
jgi:hypothetical protein